MRRADGDLAGVLRVGVELGNCRLCGRRTEVADFAASGVIEEVVVRSICAPTIFLVQRALVAGLRCLIEDARVVRVEGADEFDLVDDRNAVNSTAS
jgi:hypothetical protein